jgi:hypothetical protein
LPPDNAVIPGPAAGRNPESSLYFKPLLDSGFALPRAPE